MVACSLGYSFAVISVTRSERAVVFVVWGTTALMFVFVVIAPFHARRSRRGRRGEEIRRVDIKHFLNRDHRVINQFGGVCAAIPELSTRLNIAL